jgi:hypothetical protein
MPRKKTHYLSRRANWQHDGLKQASRSEQDVFALLDKIIPADAYTVEIKPRDARNIYMDAYERIRASLPKHAPLLRQCGIIPELSIQNNATGKKIFVEVKHQQDAGNAHERAGKYFAPGIVRRLKRIGKVTGFPVFFIFVGGIVDGRKSAKYIAELSTWFDEPSVRDRVLLWHNRDEARLRDFFETSVRPAIDYDTKAKRTGPTSRKRRPRRSVAA